MNTPIDARERTIPERVRDNIFFPLLIACGGMFCLTTMILVACSFDQSGAPVVVFFEQYAGWMIFIEMGLTVLVGITALAVDRRRTLATMQHASPSTLGASERDVSTPSGEDER